MTQDATLHQPVTTAIPPWLVATPAAIVAAAGVIVADGAMLKASFAVVIAAAALAAFAIAPRIVAVVTPVLVLVLGLGTGSGFRTHYWSYMVIAAAGMAVCIAVETIRRRISTQTETLATRDLQLSTRSIRDAVEEALASSRGRNYVEREINRAQRYDREVTIAIAEVDNFELLRQRNGDEAALDALAKLGKLLADDTRLPDGGIADDLRLIFVFPETPLLGARIAAERVRLAYQEMRLTGADGIPVTTSIGVSSFPADGKRASEVIEAAKTALGRAAALGGNRSVLSHSPEGAPAGWSAT
jgi:diguanylate cyclase (GGDEF)-like protein